MSSSPVHALTSTGMTLSEIEAKLQKAKERVANGLRENMYKARLAHRDKRKVTREIEAT